MTVVKVEAVGCVSMCFYVLIFACEASVQPYLGVCIDKILHICCKAEMENYSVGISECRLKKSLTPF